MRCSRHGFLLLVILTPLVTGVETTALETAERPPGRPLSFTGLRLQTLDPPGTAPSCPSCSSARSGAVDGVDSSIDLIPATETRLDTALPTVGSWDVEASVESAADGRLAVIVAEEFLLRCLSSTDGGRTFPSEVDVLGQAGQPPVHYFATAISSSGRLHVGAAVVDPAGDHGLQYARSEDVGQTWTAPLDLVQHGDASHGIHEVAAAAGATDQIALIYRGNRGRDPYVIASSDGGTTWTSPYRIDPGVAAGSTWTGQVDVAIDDSGNIYAVYSQTRAGRTSIWHTVSTDGGVTFAPEDNLDGIVMATAHSIYPSIEVADNGHVLVTFLASDDNLYVARSRNEGGSYSKVYQYPLAGRVFQTRPRLVVADGTSTVLLPFMIGWQVEVHRSPSNGRSNTWDDPPQVLSSFAMQSVSAVRTSGGTPTWVVGWTDTRNDSYAAWKTDVYLWSSTDEGVTWSAWQRADTDTPGAAGSIVSGVADAGGDEVFVLFRDNRGDGGCGWDLCGNQGPASSLMFGDDYRIDSDTGFTAPMSLSEPTLATDGVSHVYGAFSAWTAGQFTDILVAASGDGGYTFGTPVRVGDTSPGSTVDFLPTLAATPDGYVYLAYVSDDPDPWERELRFNRSADYGQTWLQNDVVLHDALPSYFRGQGVEYFKVYPAVSIAAQPGGAVYVAYSDESTVWLSRSFDGGSTFDTQDVDQNDTGDNTYPRLCAQGDRLVLVYRSPSTYADPSIWGAASTNRGDSWDSAQELRQPMTGGFADAVEIACDGDQSAVAVWSDLRVGSNSVRANLYNGSAWQGEHQVSGPAEAYLAPRAVYATATDVVVTYAGADDVYASRSTDGGATFPAYQRLDDAVSDPDAFSRASLITTDGAGNVWVAWYDQHAGRSSMIVRHSGDAGASFGSPLRLDTSEPEGGYDNTYWYWNTQSGSLPGAGFFTWSGERDHNRWGRVLEVLDHPERELNRWGSVLVNAHDVNDLDRDQSAAGVDCDEGDDSVWAVPGEAIGVSLEEMVGATRVSWTSQDASAGPSTSYDVVTGLLSELRTAGNYGSASCLVNGHPDTPYDDDRPDPAVGEGYYYLLRGKNGCGTGSYGDSSLSPDPRDALDASGPCP